ncbi:hypothetical protein J7E32_18750 [Bacillus sp. ISL-55]|nr:hypothetical protein [Bacillus sp. ISL-55]
MELRKVIQAMCSGHLVLVDLIFYSLIFTVLIIPAASSLLLFTVIFLLIYVSFACIFLFIRRSVGEITDYHEQ